MSFLTNIGPGGNSSGSSGSTASQSAAIYFIPTETDDPDAPILSPYAAGQGLLTVNDALPSSAAFNDPAYLSAAEDATSSTTSTSSTTYLLLAGAALLAYFLLAK